MILGIGNDIIEVERVEKACRNSHFMQRCFSETEISLFQEKPQSLAGNFAALSGAGLERTQSVVLLQPAERRDDGRQGSYQKGLRALVHAGKVCGSMVCAQRQAAHHQRVEYRLERKRPTRKDHFGNV